MGKLKDEYHWQEGGKWVEGEAGVTGEKEEEKFIKTRIEKKKNEIET